jgi:hypothetical protein
MTQDTRIANLRSCTGCERESQGSKYPKMNTSSCCHDRKDFGYVKGDNFTEVHRLGQIDFL